MNVEHYRARLLDLERTLSSDVEHESAAGRAQTADSSRDAADASVADETASEEFTEAERDSDALSEIRDALKRIDDGTYGKCVVDGGAIEEKRLDAIPWTQYCLRHAKASEQRLNDRRSTM